MRYGWIVLLWLALVGGGVVLGWGWHAAEQAWDRPIGGIRAVVIGPSLEQATVVQAFVTSSFSNETRVMMVAVQALPSTQLPLPAGTVLVGQARVTQVAPRLRISLQVEQAHFPDGLVFIPQLAQRSE